MLPVADKTGHPEKQMNIPTDQQQSFEKLAQERRDRYGLTADATLPVQPSILQLDWNVTLDENIPLQTRLYLLYLARGEEVFTWSGSAIAQLFGVERQVGQNAKYLLAKKLGRSK